MRIMPLIVSFIARHLSGQMRAIGTGECANFSRAGRQSGMFKIGSQSDSSQKNVWNGISSVSGSVAMRGCCWVTLLRLGPLLRCRNSAQRY